MVKDKFILTDPTEVSKVQEWFRTGRGAYRWSTCDLSNMSRPDILTPGDATQCWSCRGSGHTVTPPKFRVKRLPPYRGGGMEVSATGINKCIKLCRKLESHYGIDNVQWDWEAWDNGLGRGYFFTEVVEPLVIPE